MDARDELRQVGEAVDSLTRDAWRMEPGGSPGPPAGEPAFRRILVAVDGSQPSARAVRWAAAMASEHGTRVTALSVATPPGVVDHYLDLLGALAVRGPSDLLKEEERRAAAAVAEAAGALRGAGVGCDPVVAHGAATREIVRLAGEMPADLVVLGSHGDGVLDRVLLGSVAEGVRNHVAASVLLARTAPPPSRILVPVDGSRQSKLAAAVGLRLARAWDAEATVLYVFSPLAYGPVAEVKRAYQEAVGRDAPRWPKLGARMEVAFGPPASEILAALRDGGHGLVVMGSRGLGGLHSLAAGSVSNAVSHQAPCSVLLVKAPLP